MDAAQAIETLRESRRSIAASLIAVKGHLDKPYPDDPRWTPWTRFIERELQRLDGEYLFALSVVEARVAELREEREGYKRDYLAASERVVAAERERDEAKRETDGAYRVARSETTAGTERVTHGRHCKCSACAREDWTNPNLACCGMHGPSCPPVYAPLGSPGEQVALSETPQ